MIQLATSPEKTIPKVVLASTISKWNLCSPVRKYTNPLYESPQGRAITVTQTTIIARETKGMVIVNGDSCMSACLVRSLPKNTTNDSLPMYIELINTPTSIVARSKGPLLSATAINISSLLKNPESGAIPATTAAPIRKEIVVIGMAFLNPPIFHMEVSPFRLCIILPAPRNKSALDKPCATRCNIAAPAPNEPSESIINPKWLIVEYASMRFMSVATNARVLPSKKVIVPTDVMIIITYIAPSNTGRTLATR